MVRRRGDTLFGSAVVTTLCLVGCTTYPATGAAADEDPFCTRVRNAYVGARWVELRPGERLSAFDGVLSCRGGRVVLKATGEISADLDWVRTSTGVIGTVGERTFVAMFPLPGYAGNLDVEVLEVSGPVYYSRDRHLIRAAGTDLRKVLDPAEMEMERRGQESDLAGMTWEALAEGRILAPWEMIWTGHGGRVEIEFLEGPNKRLNDWTAVLDAAGHPTGKNRLPANMYFIMSPTFWRRARVNKVIGEVRVATDSEEVKAFLGRHKQFFSLVEDLYAQDEQALQQWRDILRKPELE